MSPHGSATAGTVLHWARSYDVLAWVITLGREKRFRRRLAQLARLSAGESVLDVGCGTGSLAIEAKGHVGASGEVAGVDPSPEMVARARRKADKAGAEVRFETAGAEALPFPDGRFDVVLGTLMLHHLTDEGRRAGLAEIGRVLKPGGRFLAVDVGGERGGFRHGPLNRHPAHADFDLDALTPQLEGAGFEMIDRGPLEGQRLLGMPKLRFVLAGIPSH